jgi:CotH kinase protein/Lamin Tail Domain
MILRGTIAAAVTVAAVAVLFEVRLAAADIVISEISSKGTSNACGHANHSDWIELHNTANSTSMDLAGFILHDDRGINDTQAFTFPQDYPALQAGEYRLICCTRGGDAATSPQFAIGGDDTITLVASDRSTIVGSVGPLPGTQDKFNVTYAWDPTATTTNASSTALVFNISSTPTPGLPNVLTPLPVGGGGGGGGGGGETVEQIKQRLKQQNDLGTRFFGMDANGLPVQDAFDPVLDFHITMKNEDYTYMMQHKFFETYAPFESARLVSVPNSSLPGAQKGGAEILSINSPGRIRTKGQSSLYMATCIGSDTVPFQVEFDPSLGGETTLFGVEKLYLRSHFLDPTFARDWTLNRLLARFGLPHLRSRKVRFYINGNYIGFYTVVEAIDQEYVFARSFPDYDPFNYALYKWKIEAIGCGRYDPDQLADAATRLEAHLQDPSLPYSFEPGDHRIPPPSLGKAGFPACMYTYTEQYYLGDIRDVATLYLLYNEDCGEMLVGEGLMDRDLGTRNWDEPMKRFINKYLTEKVVYGDSEMDQDVDLESFLKTTAFYAVMLSQDSPMGTMNNYYMAQSGDGKGFKLLAYDHNIGPGSSCPCGDHMIHWSIARPTCSAFEFNRVVGPLLLKPDLHARYLEYVRDFIDQAAGKADFLEEVHNHVTAIYRYVREDYWYMGGEYPAQFSMDGSDWDHSWRQPIVPFLVARVDDIREQLKALDAGTIARGPHLAVPVEPYEQCVDWRNISQAPPEPACYNDCIYEGCYMNYWEVTHKCIEETGTCLHGTYDISCRGIKEGEQYPGMESPRAMTGLETFCMRPYGLQPIKASVCPPPPPPDQDSLNFNYWYKVNQETNDLVRP